MKHITENELKALLLAQKGATPVTISAITDTRARKTNNPYDKILKFSVVNGFTGFDYEASVNRQLVREAKDPQFEAQERSWGTNVNNTVVELKGKFYLSLRPLHSTKPIYLAQKGKVLKRIEKSAIEHLLPPVCPALNQGTEKEVVYRNYALENIRAISIHGVRYVVLH